jgi:hypothetical protein
MIFEKIESGNVKYIEVKEMACWLKDGKELLAKGFVNDEDLNTYIDGIIQNLNNLRGKDNDK